MVTLTDCTFAWLRRELAPVLSVPEEQIQFDTPLSWLIPAERRRAVWRVGEQRLGLEFPTLDLSPAMQRSSPVFIAV